MLKLWISTIVYLLSVGNKVWDNKFSKEIVCGNIKLLFLYMCDLWPHSIQTLIQRSLHSFHQSLNHYDQPSVVVQSQTCICKWQRNKCNEIIVHISRILPWIMWLMTIPNWFKWSFFLLWQKHTGSVCAGQQKQGNVRAIWWPLLITLQLVLGVILAFRISLRRALTDESRRKGKIKTLHVSSITSYWHTATVLLVA